MAVWKWYMTRAVWLRVVIAVVVAFVALAIISAFIPSDEEAQDDGTRALNAPTRTDAAAIAQDQPSPSPAPAATPAPTPEPTATPEPTPAPTPSPPPSLEARIAQSVRDNRSFMPRASTDKMTVEITPIGRAIIAVQPTLANETDALTVASHLALVANRAIWTTYPEITEVEVEVQNELTDALGAKSIEPVTTIRVGRATGERFQYDGLKQRVLADNKHMYCVADGYIILGSIYREIRDRGCLMGPVK